MKVKLLKKLHKRFKWRYDKNAMFNPWEIYDKETKREIYPDLPMCGYWYSERTIYALMKILGISFLWSSNHERKSKRRYKQKIKEDIEKWENL